MMSATLWPQAAAAFSIGLVGSMHCVAMCGGLVAAHAMAPNQASPPRAVRRLALLNLGRVVTYALLAGATAALGSLILQPEVANLVRTAGAVVLVLIGLRIGGWSQAVVRIEQALRKLVAGRQVPSLRKASRSGWNVSLVSGLLWGAMPCSLVYTTMLWAVASGGMTHAVTTMLAFGAGTLPLMIVTGLAARRLKVILQQTRRVTGAALILFGVMTLPFVQGFLIHAHTAAHAH